MSTRSQMHRSCLTLPVAATIVLSCIAPALGDSIRPGLPGRRMAGGLRCDHACIRAEQTTQTLLIPENNLLVTEQAAPTFFAYLPATSGNPLIELIVTDENNQTIYTDTVQGNASEGIARIDLSTADTTPAFQPDQTYRWYLIIVCNEQDRSADLNTAGSFIITTASNTTASELHSMQWMQRLATLDDIRRSDPDNQTAELEWQSLLAEENLDIVSHAKPIEVGFSEVP